MDDSYTNRRKKPNRARERYQARQRRRESMVVPRIRPGDSRLTRWLNETAPLRARVGLLAQDGWWYARNVMAIRLGLAVAAVLLFLWFAGSHVLAGRIFPGVWSGGVYLGGLTVDEATTALQQAFAADITIKLWDGERTWDARPADMGLRLDARPAAEAARGVGMAGIPLGWNIEPALSLEYITAQNYLLDLAQQVEVRPMNAGYQWTGSDVVGVPGSEGRMLDVGLTMERLQQDTLGIFQARRLDLIMSPLEPDILDPRPYLDEVRALATQPFYLNGYDPFRDEEIAWGTTTEMFVSWLEAGSNGLMIREETFMPFLRAQVSTLNPDGGDLRYLEPSETITRLSEAVSNGNTAIDLRIRYRPTQFVVGAGDVGYQISRKTGIPYYLIERANEGRNMDRLSIGDVVNVPSRDVTLPVAPVLNKRIIVDLGRQLLVAYENDQEVFRWSISSGQSSAPTAPGVFQILSHNDVAFGSSYTLCGSQGCGQWQMYWFMGIYEVVPGLMNGFHGAVLLPNGGYLNGGNVGAPSTFGCVMSLNENAEALYQWADIGTIVEIISPEFPPQSELARRAINM